MNSEEINELFGHGGKRQGAGRKTKADAAPQAVHTAFATARARDMAARASLRELEARQRAGDLVEREAVRKSSATAFATIAQALRAIPDALERRLGLDPVMAEKVAALIDDAMGELAADLERMGSQTQEAPSPL